MPSRTEPAAPAAAHRRAYPSQYEHPLCGRCVRVVVNGTEQTQGRIQRVVASRFGLVAMLEAYTPLQQTGWMLSDCIPHTEPE